MEDFYFIVAYGVSISVTERQFESFMAELAEVFEPVVKLKEDLKLRNRSVCFYEPDTFKLVATHITNF